LEEAGSFPTFCRKSTPIMRVGKPLLTVGGIVILFVGGLFFLLRGCLSKYDERAALAPILYFEKDGKSVVFSIVKFEKATSYSRKGGITSKSVSTNYFIQANDAITGKKNSDKKIRHQRDIKSYPIRVMGASANNAWVFIGEIMAFDPFTLDKIADTEILEQKNPSIKGKLPKEERYYKFSHADKNIYFTAIDGSTWQLDTKTLQVSETSGEAGLTPEENEVKQLEKLLKDFNAKQDSLMEQKLRRPSRMLQNKEITMAQYQAITKEFHAERTQLYKERDSLHALQSKASHNERAAGDVKRRIANLMGDRINFSQVKSNQDTINGKWYGLYTKQELEKLYDRVQHQAVYGETARRQLFTASFTPDKYGNFIIDKKNAIQVGTAGWLDGGLLLDRNTGTPLHPGNPASMLIVYKNQIGNEGTIQVARLSTDGKQAWTFDTGLKEWKDFVCTDRQLFILGTNNKDLSGDDCNVLWCVDLNSGQATHYDFFTDK
jgi:hypothetical protein